MVVVCIVFFITGLPISYYSARFGLDIDLLTRGAGFGYLGSTLTSLIYASFTFIFFAIEAAILSSALHLLFGIPMAIAYILCAVAVIPIVVKGISAISKFQVGTQTLWLVLQIAALAVVAFNEFDQFQHWITFTPEKFDEPATFSWLLFGSAASIFFALIAQIGEQVDYLRFLPEKTNENKKQWWFWLILSGPGWVFVGLIKMLLGSFLAFVAIQQGFSMFEASDPTLMYQRAFQYIVHNEQFALILAGLMVIISQMKINVTNAYAGSIAWSNFFSRLTHSHPGRVVWLVFNVSLALLLMELGIHQVLESILSVFAFVAVSWLCCLAADLMINKPLGLSPKEIEFKRGYLYDINPVGMVSMILATISGLFCYLGFFGENIQTLGHFVSIGVCFISVPFIAWVTKGKYYLARNPQDDIIVHDSEQQEHTCEICLNTFEKPDVLFCPAYQQVICSLCCSLDVRCLDQCKTEQPAEQGTLLNSVIAMFKRESSVGRASRFAVWFTLINTLIASLLALVYQHTVLQTGAEQPILSGALWILFFTLLIVTGVVTWLFLLAHESRVNAQQESNRQTIKLIHEIDAHKETDLKLQQAKDLAERANAAKSRYLSGISHELRTPLQSILGYAQLLSSKKEAPESFKNGLDIINRSGQHLTDLIEGLLDVSKIEAGRLELHSTNFPFQSMIQQLVDMFSMTAKSKNIDLVLVIHDTLPTVVNADEKRVRQVLINLISNAIKYTTTGSVEVHVRYRSQVAEFEIIDTGVGIPLEEQDRIFSPFERIHNEQHQGVQGTGLGLTIVKLLVEIMGGDLQLTSEVNQGSRFKVSLMLPWVHQPKTEFDTTELPLQLTGFGQKICVVDDEPLVLSWVTDILQPHNFLVLTANNSEEVLIKHEETLSDIALFILDVNLPGMNGLTLSKHLRSMGITAPILMLSANAQTPTMEEKALYGFNDYLIKPIQQESLIEAIRDRLLSQSTPISDSLKPQRNSLELTNQDDMASLLSAIDIGYKKGIIKALVNLHASNKITKTDFNKLVSLANAMQFSQIQILMEALNHDTV
jgi:signal transduction histidine kinase/DNA-binding response OmpR family regulator